MNTNTDCFFSRSLEIFQSQINGLNRLYNLHHSLINSVNSNLILLTQQHNNYYNVGNRSDDNNTNVNNTNTNNTNVNNTNTNNTNVNNTNTNTSIPASQLGRTTWDYGSNLTQNNITSLNNTTYSHPNQFQYNRTYIPPPPPPPVLRPLNQNNLASRPSFPPPPIPPPPIPPPYISQSRVSQSRVSQSHVSPPSRNSWQENRNRRRVQYNFTQHDNTRERPVVWFGRNFDPSNNSWRDLSNNILGGTSRVTSRSSRNNTPPWRRRRGARRNRSRFVPFYWEMSGPSNISDLLNESLYDTIPRNSLPNNLFNANTTTNSWDTIQNQNGLPRNNICPITRERFLPDNNVTRIDYCGHLFNNDSLLEWFRYDTRCPICRYDLYNANTDLSNNVSTNNLTDNVSTNTDNVSTNTDNVSNNSNSYYDFNSNLANMLDPSFSMFDLSQNIHSFSNEIANNIMNVLGGIDLSSNIIGAAAELTFNIPNNQSTSNVSYNFNPQNSTMDENLEEELVENIVEEILNNMDSVSNNNESNSLEEKTEDEDNLLEEKTEDEDNLEENIEYD